MTVTLQVIEDHQALAVSADVAITNPAQPGRGTVYTDDNGAIYWENNTSHIRVSGLAGAIQTPQSVLVVTTTANEPGRYRRWLG